MKLIQSRIQTNNIISYELAYTNIHAWMSNLAQSYSVDGHCMNSIVTSFF